MINIEKEQFGTLHNNTNICGTDLIDALSSLFTQDSWTHGILYLGPAKSASASPIFLLLNHCYIFNPHSRDKIGMPMDPVTSVLLHFTDIETYCLYIAEVAERMDTNQYNLTIIKIRYCQEQYLHDQQQIDNEKNKKKLQMFMHCKEASRSILSTRKSFRTTTIYKQSRKEHMYKRQNVHKINSSRSDICNTEHNITSI